VVFKAREHAEEAIGRYNTVPLDGRPLKISLASQGALPNSGKGDIISRLNMCAACTHPD
jgi:RNA recognition motif-containing protein